MGLEKEIAIQELFTQGKAREAYLLRQRMDMEERLGEKLSEAQIANLNALSGRLYDLQHPAEAALETTPESTLGPGQAAQRQAASGLRLDRLQRIGANVTVPVSSPEKVTLDKQLNVQEQMNAKMDALIQNSCKMRF